MFLKTCCGAIAGSGSNVGSVNKSNEKNVYQVQQPEIRIENLCDSKLKIFQK